MPAALDEADDTADGTDSLTRLLSMKGAGPVVAAGPVRRGGRSPGGRQSWAGARLLGVAPVTRKSGGNETHHKRRAMNRHGHNALHHFAAAAIAADPGFQRQKEVLKARGHNHARILRTLGDRLLRIFFAMQRDKTLYDPARTLQKAKAA